MVLNRHAGPMYIDREAGARRHVVFKRVSVPLPNGSSSKKLGGADAEYTQVHARDFHNRGGVATAAKDSG